jgi:endonuclease/exonuclease/phosphatase family metal-dependent hydrolase
MFWLPAVLSPLVPWLLLADVLLLLVLAYRRERAAFIMLGALLIGLPFVRRCFGIFAEAETDRPLTQELTVATLNTFAFHGPGDRPHEKPAEALSALLSIEADVVALQEMPTGNRGRSFRDHFTAHSDLTHWYQPAGKMLAIWSRYPLAPVAAVFPENEHTGYLVVDVHLPTDTVRVFNLRLRSNDITQTAAAVTSGGDLAQRDTWAKIKTIFGRYGRAAGHRARELQDLRGALAASPHPVLVMGDFNDVPASYVYRRITGAALYDAWVQGAAGIGATFRGSLPGLRIDWILYDATFRAQKATVVEVAFSDHRLLLARLRY